VRVEVSKIKNLFRSFFRVDAYRVEKWNAEGESLGVFERLNIDRGDAVAMVLYKPKSQSVVLIRQFRLAAQTRNSDGFIWEVPAGMIEPGEHAEEVARRESLEETGYELQAPELIYQFMPAPGLMNEIIYLFYAEVDDHQRVGDGGGLANEGEFIEVHDLPLTTCGEMLRRGQIEDAKTIVALQYLLMRYAPESA
jgi:nudix-type nucleoside diphosphatase (YffH/AdpP family)